MRDYQYAMVHTALFHNTLVCLPTGLGKTLIAAVVMYNYYRWFPHGKVVFVAPTRPLVEQQLSACRRFMGIPMDDIIMLLSKKNAADERSDRWRDGRVFFCTPQILYNDLKTGVCAHESIVCLVVDECHRATKEHDIVKAVKELKTNKVKFRVLGLSATPGSNHAGIQV